MIHLQVCESQDVKQRGDGGQESGEAGEGAREEGYIFLSIFIRQLSVTRMGYKWLSLEF